MTALEWLEQRIKDTYDKEGKLPIAYTLDLIRQAKEMEKEQLNLARLDGINLANQGYGKPLDPEYMRKWIQKNAAPKTTHDPENP